MLYVRIILSASMALMLARPALAGDATSVLQMRTDAAPTRSVAELSESTETPKSGPNRALATAAAVFPGVLFHGFGHYVAGDKATAYKLARWQLVGFTMMATSIATIALSGATRYGNEISIPTLILGSGLFINSFVADVYGSAVGPTGPNDEARPERIAPRQAASLGYGYVDDPQFDFAHFAVLRGRASWSKAHIDPELWIALGADNQRARLPLTYQLLKKGTEQLALTTALTYHGYGDDGFATYVAEASIGIRFNMDRLGDSLRGSFSRASLGGGVQLTSYDVDGVPSDTVGLLLGRFGYGFTLPGAGEIEGYYEHRRDGFSAGLSPSQRNGSGFLGHFGLRLDQPVHGPLSLKLSTEIGAAWVSTAALEMRL